jgi:hypothetical protein
VTPLPSSIRRHRSPRFVHLLLNLRLYWIHLVPEIHALPLFLEDHGVLGEIASPREHIIDAVRLTSAAPPLLRSKHRGELARVRSELLSFAPLLSVSHSS